MCLSLPAEKRGRPRGSLNKKTLEELKAKAEIKEEVKKEVKAENDDRPEEEEEEKEEEEVEDVENEEEQPVKKVEPLKPESPTSSSKSLDPKVENTFSIILEIEISTHLCFFLSHLFIINKFLILSWELLLPSLN